MKAQQQAQEELARADAVKRHMEAEMRAKDEAMQRELQGMKSMMDEFRAQLDAPAPTASLPSRHDVASERPLHFQARTPDISPATVYGRSPGRETPNEAAAGVHSIPIHTPPGLDQVQQDGGLPDDGDDDDDDDKPKKEKQFKKD